ncbi:MAG: TIGR04282 family arsenosugar biosynthesis glycosyltransferase [Proteobacteria bacterium]|nr:TIGR04282 family arsenosugar biosynthesis glycosyltransferase [Pseudomonadota bacterium]
MTPTRIIIFAKAPQPGFAKTRLIPALGAEGAAELAQQMLFNTLHEALSADIGTVELCITPKIDDIAWQGITFPLGTEITDQGEGDLGARLARASDRAIENGRSAILIGTDCVEMSATLLREAAQSLHEHDAVIHCAADGGYALLGLKRYSAVLFSDMPWSTDAVASTTIARIGQLAWSLHVGQLLHDVDAPQDLKYLSPKMVVA